MYVLVLMRWGGRMGGRPDEVGREDGRVTLTQCDVIMQELPVIADSTASLPSFLA